MVEFADSISKSIQLLYFPPDHSKYNPIERCWGILEQHWNGALFSNLETMLSWVKTMKWKGHDLAKFTDYDERIRLSEIMNEPQMNIFRY